MTEQQASNIKTIAIIGGTGKEGKGLAYRWAKQGYRIVIGSRQAEKAQRRPMTFSVVRQRWVKWPACPIQKRRNRLMAGSDRSV